MCWPRSRYGIKIAKENTEVDMPDERTRARARKEARQGKAPTTQAGEFIHEEIRTDPGMTEKGNDFEVVVIDSGFEPVALGERIDGWRVCWLVAGTGAESFMW